MNDNRDEIQRLRAMRAEAINRGDFGRADAIGADLARLEPAAGGRGGEVAPHRLDRALAGGADRRHELRVVFHSSCHESIRLLDIDAVTEPGSDCSDIERDRALSRRCGGCVRHESTLPFQRFRWA